LYQPGEAAEACSPPPPVPGVLFNLGAARKDLALTYNLRSRPGEFEVVNGRFDSGASLSINLVNPRALGAPERITVVLGFSHGIGNFTVTRRVRIRLDRVGNAYNFGTNDLKAVASDFITILNENVRNFDTQNAIWPKDVTVTIQNDNGVVFEILNGWLRIIPNLVAAP
jgi:hypothetical protein